MIVVTKIGMVSFKILLFISASFIVFSYCDDDNDVFDMLRRIGAEATILKLFNTNVNNTVAILDFLDSISAGDAAVGYETLFNLMRDNLIVYTYPVMMLTQRIQMALNSRNYNQYDRQFLASVWNRLPENVKQFPWDVRVQIHNLYHSQFLDCDEEQLTKSTIKRSVYTTTPLSCKSDTCDWEITSVGKGYCSRIKSKHFSENLQAEERVEQNRIRKVFISMKEDSYFRTCWFFEPVEFTNHYRIRISDNPDYLLCKYDDLFNRRTSVFLSHQNLGTKCIWSITKL